MPVDIDKLQRINKEILTVLNESRSDADTIFSVLASQIAIFSLALEQDDDEIDEMFEEMKDAVMKVIADIRRSRNRVGG